MLRATHLPLAVYRPSQKSTCGERGGAEADPTGAGASWLRPCVWSLSLNKSQCGAGEMPRVRLFTRRTGDGRGSCPWLLGWRGTGAKDTWTFAQIACHLVFSVEHLLLELHRPPGTDAT